MSEGKQSRKRLEAAVEALLALLDEMDGDADLEDTGDYEAYITGSTSDREADYSDDEPYLSTGTDRWAIQSSFILDGEADGPACAHFVHEKPTS